MKVIPPIAILFIFILSLSVVAGQPLKVVTFNIRYETESDGNNQWQLRKSSVSDFINYEEPDFVGMQEALLNQIDDIVSTTNYKWTGVGRDDGTKRGEFAPIFYGEGWDLIETSTFWLSETPDQPSQSWDAAFPRICTWGKFINILTSDTLFVFNTHYDHVGQLSREKASEIILEKIEALCNYENAILLGDFNATISNKAIELIMKSPLKDAFNTAPLRFGPDGTFNAFDINKIPERRIDYVFSSPDFKVLKYAVDSRLINGRYLSDHFPVIVTLEWR